jgi:hypothetical protein
MIVPGILVHVRIAPYAGNTFTAVVLESGPIEDGTATVFYHVRGESGIINGRPAQGVTEYANANASEVAVVPF